MTTAIRRFEVFELTLESFSRGLLQHFSERRLILNIDPLGGSPGDAERMIALARSYFPEVVSRCPSEGSFPAAVRWGWSQTSTDWILHLEDDWLLNRGVNRDYLYSLMQSPTQLIKFNLSRNDALCSTGFSLNPSFIRKSLLHRLLPVFDLNKNPERQFSWLNAQFMNPANPQRFVAYGQPHGPRMVTDIGKRWTFLHFRRTGSPTGLYKYPTAAANAPQQFWRWLRHQFFLAFYRLRIALIGRRAAVPARES